MVISASFFSSIFCVYCITFTIDFNSILFEYSFVSILSRFNLGKNNKILKNDDISRCIVHKMNDKNGRDILCAYYLSEKEVNIKDLKEEMQKNLPYYMIPQYFIKIAEVPININGNIKSNCNNIAMYQKCINGELTCLAK